MDAAIEAVSTYNARDKTAPDGEEDIAAQMVSHRVRECEADVCGHWWGCRAARFTGGLH